MRVRAVSAGGRAVSAGGWTVGAESRAVDKAVIEVHDPGVGPYLRETGPMCGAIT